MINRRWLMLTLLSAALNAAFVATWAVHALPDRIKTDPITPGQEHECDGMGPVHHRIGADREQRRRMEMRMREFNENRREISERIQDLQTRMLDLIAADETDMDELEAVQEQILEQQRKMQDMVVSNLLAEKEDLTPEQREAFFRMLRMRSPGQGGAMRGRTEGQMDDRPRGGPGRGSQESHNKEVIR